MYCSSKLGVDDCLEEEEGASSAKEEVGGIGSGLGQRSQAECRREASPKRRPRGGNEW
jgi:hypothetical protein